MVKYDADQTLSVGHQFNHPRKVLFFFFFFKFVLSKTAEEKYYSSTVTVYESSNFENTMQFQKLIQNQTVQFHSDSTEDTNQAINLFTGRLLHLQSTSQHFANGLSSINSDSLLPLRKYTCSSPPYSHGTVRRQRLSLMICWSSWSTEPFWNRKLRQ